MTEFKVGDIVFFKKEYIERFAKYPLKEWGHLQVNRHSSYNR